VKRLVLIALVACGSQQAQPPAPALHEARLPRAPGAFGPSLAIVANAPAADISHGTQLSDVDSCATCHPDVAAQWSASAHSFASFGNPIYRANIEGFRSILGKTPSRHCGGCHDMPLVVDGLLTSEAPIPPADLRSHSGVTCRLCHGIQKTRHDGNGSYLLDATPIDAPDVDDAASIARHKRQVTTKVDTELCVGCHRGFLSPDMEMPVHLTGIDEPGQWRNSAYTGNGMARVDKVEKRDCISCHMERVAASKTELGAKHGSVASHRFVGGHTWMAAMRDDTEQLRLTQAKLEGAASIDIAGMRAQGKWYLPADAAPLVPNTRVELDVVIRNLLVGHRFPGGVLDIQDTWIELEVVDRDGKRIASSGLAHEADPNDAETHVLKTIVVDDHGDVLEQHEMAKFRTQVATQTLAAREAQAARYAFTVPAKVAMPVTVTARLRHRSRTLKMQASVCDAFKTKDGQAFRDGARGARDVSLDPCKPQPITLIASTSLELGDGAVQRNMRPAWERTYEHGMALVASLVTRLDEARTVLEVALAKAPDDRAKAMVHAQLGWVASRQNRVDAALDHVATARKLLGGAEPPVFDAIIADTYMRMNHYAEAVAPAKSCTERAPSNAGAWAVYARALVAVGNHTEALAAARKGLELAPRDPSLLSSQATALAALGDPQASEAQTAYTRFRAPDEAPGLRIRCVRGNASCMRDRNPVHTIELVP
jgi:tetratricopeptide (TPR) repeat protein